MPVGANTPVIVIDLQTGMFDGVHEPPLHDADNLVERARAVIAWARRTGRKVAFIRHDGPPGDSLAPGEPGWSVWPALGQAKDEPTFAKTVANAFSNPDLTAWVKGQGAGAVILLGAQTDYCINGTIEGALDAGLAVTVVADAHATVDQPERKASTIIAQHNQKFAADGAELLTTAELTGSV